MPIIKVRKNREATGDHDRWRLIIDGEQTLVSGANIKGCRVFTEAEVLPGGDIKYNICVDAHSVRIRKGVAFIK